MFHLLLEEAIVTLVDLASQLGLCGDGEAVIGVSSDDLVSKCEPLLRSLPLPNVIKRNTIKLS